jgi:hypothetical protein
MPEHVLDSQSQRSRAPGYRAAERDAAGVATALSGPGAGILSLQRVIGNRATAHLLAPATVQREGDDERQAEAGTTEAVLPPGGAAGQNAAAENAAASAGNTSGGGADAAAAQNQAEPAVEAEAPVQRYTDADRVVLEAAVADDGVIGSYQMGLVPRALNHLTQPAYETFRSIIDNAGSDLERAYLFKALAAGRNLADITNFSGRIRGRSERWLRRNLTLVNTAGGGGGVTQQYSDSCAPTTQQALHGQFDPIYALELRSSGNIAQQTPNALTDPTTLANRREAREQRNLLTSGGGSLADRATGGGAGVSDTNYRQLVNRLASTTGVSYVARYIPGDLSWDQAFRRMNRALDQGIAMPAGVTSPPPSSGGHAVLLTRHEGNRYQIHDPWTGQTVWKTRSEFRNNSLNLPSGWNQMDMIMVPVALDLRRLRPDESAPAAATG